jgi:hypothetical protein
MARAVVRFVTLSLAISAAGCLPHTTGNPDAGPSIFRDTGPHDSGPRPDAFRVFIDGGTDAAEDAYNDGGNVCPGACTIADACVPDGMRNPANPCEVCDVTANAFAYSPNTGAACDDGAYCTTGDVCTGTVCGGSSRNCSDGVACDGSETCDELDDTCVAGASPCPAGTLCAPVTDTCVSSCSGGTVSCTGSCVDTRFDPTHCGSCANACPAASHAMPACLSGTCGLACDAGYRDCDATPGCETFVVTDASHCGSCGNACAVGATCQAGACVPP